MTFYRDELAARLKDAYLEAAMPALDATRSSGVRGAERLAYVDAGWRAVAEFVLDSRFARHHGTMERWSSGCRCRWCMAARRLKDRALRAEARGDLDVDSGVWVSDPAGEFRVVDADGRVVDTVAVAPPSPRRGSWKGEVL